MKHILKIVSGMGLVFFGLQPVLTGSYKVQYNASQWNDSPETSLVVSDNSAGALTRCMSGPKLVTQEKKGHFNGCNSQDTPIEFTAKFFYYKKKSV